MEIFTDYIVYKSEHIQTKTYPKCLSKTNKEHSMRELIKIINSITKLNVRINGYWETNDNHHYFCIASKTQESKEITDIYIMILSWFFGDYSVITMHNRQLIYLPTDEYGKNCFTKTYVENYFSTALNGTNNANNAIDIIYVNRVLIDKQISYYPSIITNCNNPTTLKLAESLQTISWRTYLSKSKQIKANEIMLSLLKTNVVSIKNY